MALASVADQSVALAPPRSLGEFEPWLVAAWTNLLVEEALMRSQHLGSAGVEIRRSRVARHRTAIGDVIDALRPDRSDTDRAEIIDVALLLTSSTALFEFIDVLEISVERGARLAAQTLVALIEARR